MKLLNIHQLTKTYGSGHAATNALRGLTLAVDSGEFLVIQGASGSGKTTLLNLLAGFDAPDGGSISFMDADMTRMTDAQRTDIRRRHMGFVFQNMNLLPTLTATENIALQLALNGTGLPSARTEAVRLLQRANLADRADAFPEQLSGGEQQRTAVLRALIHKPELLLLDEPTSCLDTETTKVLLDLLATINQEHGTTILIATHDPRVADKAKRSATISDGVMGS